MVTIAKPTTADLRKVVDTTFTDDRLTAVIDDAALIAAGCRSIAGYPEDRQKAIVKYLAAHLVAVQGGSTGALSSKALGDASESYAVGQLGESLKGTSYGQQALVLEPSGCLAGLGRVRSYFKVL